ncbi:hypothetical protein GF348_21245 [candidate division KSB3 bacterium]|nr:hypothetical protein [candidate division KSB3 bacterium]
MDIILHSQVQGVKIMRAGIPHKDNPDALWTREELEDMVSSTASVLPYLKQTFGLTEYPGNEEHINTHGEPIPAFLNLNHNRDLSETIREAVKDVTVQYRIEELDGTPWIVADYNNVPPDVAEYLQTRYYGRSIEILPQLQVNSQWYQNVIRSVGFLSPDLFPYVPEAGQSDFVVQQTEAQDVMCIFHAAPPQATIINQQQEDSIMSEQNTSSAQSPVTETQVQEYAAQITRMQEKLTEAQEQRRALEHALQEREAKLHAQNVQHYCNQMTTQQVAPAIVKQVQDLLIALPDSIVFHDSAKPINEHVQTLIQELLTAAREMTLFTPPTDTETVASGAVEHTQEDQAQIYAAAKERAQQMAPNASPYELAKKTALIAAQYATGGQIQ